MVLKKTIIILNLPLFQLTLEIDMVPGVSLSLVTYYFEDDGSYRCSWFNGGGQCETIIPGVLSAPVQSPPYTVSEKGNCLMFIQSTLDIRNILPETESLLHIYQSRYSEQLNKLSLDIVNIHIFFLEIFRIIIENFGGKCNFEARNL